MPLNRRVGWVLVVAGSILGGFAIVLLGGLFELNMVFDPGIAIDKFLNPAPYGMLRKEPDLLWFIWGNIAFWSLILLIGGIVTRRFASQHGRRRTEATP